MCRMTFKAGRVWMRSLGLVGLLVAFFSPILHAGSSTIETVNCGQILEREFDEAHQIHDYKIMMESGGTLNLRVVPLGDTLAVRAAIYEPVGQQVAETSYRQEIRLTSGKLSGKGTHTIKVRNSEDISYSGEGRGDSRVGVYTLEISCVLSDGSKVDAGSSAGGLNGVPLQAAPGGSQAGVTGTGLEALGKYADDVQKVQAAAGAAQQAVQLVSGVVDLAKRLKWGKKKEAQGSPDAPVPAYPRPEDMMAKGQQLAYAQPVETSAVLAPRPMTPPVQTPPAVDRQTFPLLGLGTVLQGEISASTGAQGCRFQGKAGQGIDLKFERLMGDQGLVVTVFGPDRQPVFLTSVLASPKIATKLQLPVAGEYAVEVSAAGQAGGSPARFSLHLAAASK